MRNSITILKVVLHSASFTFSLCRDLESHFRNFQRRFQVHSSVLKNVARGIVAVKVSFFEKGLLLHTVRNSTFCPKDD